METVLNSQSRRVLLLTQWFDPEPTIKGLVFARELVRLGYEVEVLTGVPNYPGGKVYSGYKVKLLQREMIDGVQITRVPLYPSHDQGALRRVANYVSFSFSALFYGLWCAKRPDVIYAYHPPLTVGIAAAIIRFLRRVPVVYDVQDMWPDTLRATGMISSARALRAVEIVCRWVYKNVDHVVVLSPGFKRLLLQRGVSESKVEVIYNWCDEHALGASSPAPPLNFPGKDKFRILFAGNLGRAQALEAVLNAARLLWQGGNHDIVFVFLGDGVDADRLKKIALDKGLANVIFLPPVPMHEVGSALHAADALLVHLKSDPLFEITIPSKTQAYMAVGKPILMAVQGDAADLVLQSECGELATSEDPESIAAAALKLRNVTREGREAMAERGRSYYQKNLSISVGVKKFGTVFEKLVRAGVKN